MALESTRITLIRCMRKLVREKSFSKIKVEEICASAHISRRTFYRYYKDKYALLKDVYTDSFFKILISSRKTHSGISSIKYASKFIPKRVSLSMRSQSKGRMVSGKNCEQS